MRGSWQRRTREYESERQTALCASLLERARLREGGGERVQLEEARARCRWRQRPHPSLSMKRLFIYKTGQS